MLLATILVARMLGKTVYGELSIIQSTVTMFGTFAGFGLGLTATKYVAEFRQSDPERAGRILGISGLMAVLTGGLMSVGLLVFAPWLAEHTINAPHLSNVLRISALILFISALNGAQTGALAGLEAFKTIARVNLLTGLISFPLLLGGAYLWSLTGAVSALAINIGLSWLLNHLALRSERRRHGVPISFRTCGREISIMWRFSLPAFLSGVVVGPIVWACDAIVVNQENGYANLGIYNAAFQIMLIIGILNNMVGQALLPVCVSLREVDDERFNYVNIVFPWVVGIGLALPFLCVPELWAHLYGEEYAGRAFSNTVVLVAFFSIVIAHRQGVARNFIANDLLWWSVLGNAFWGVVAILCTYLLRDFGSEGRAASFALAYALNTIIFIPFYMKMKLCPKHLLLSRYSILIWGIIGFLTVLNVLFDVDLLVRAVILAFAYLSIVFLLWLLWRITRGMHIGGSGNVG